MQINTVDKYSVDSIVLDKPKKEEDYYYSKLNFVIQTPKLNILKLNDKTISILINDKLESLFNSFDKKMIELISSNSSEYFEESFTVDETEDIYKNSFKFKKEYNYFTSNISKKMNIYNKHKDSVNISELGKNDSVICLIKCTKMIFYKTYCMPYWEIFQIKYKEPVLNTKEYLFIEDLSDNYCEKEEELETNLKLIKITK